MSILLDALRKSEKDQQKVETPGIHSGEQSKPASVFIQKGWLLLLIVVVFASSSLAWYLYRKPEASNEPSAIQASGAGSADNQRPAEPEGKADIGKRPSEVANDTAKLPRTPVEAYQQAAGTGAQSRRGVAGKTTSAQSAGQLKQVSEGGNRKPAAQEQTTNNQAFNKQAAAARPGNRQAANQKVNGKPAANKSTTAKSAETSQKKPFRPQPPAPISYWELPDSVRANVPEMRFTVLVYAKDPADRFVLIDGQRYGQGEQVQPDLVVREIRRRSVVFKYRLYIFLVEK